MSTRQDAKDRLSTSEHRSCLRRVLEQELLDVVFQPIVDVRTAEIIGYEALSRPPEECGYDGPADLFFAAEEFGVIDEIERLARKKIFGAAVDFDPTHLLFINNSPPVFTSDSFVELISAEIEYFDHLQLNRIVLEVTERTSPNLIADLNVRALLLREMGFQVAIDDVGAGINGLNQIMSLRPNWIKLDRELINQIDYDPLKQNLIRTFVRFSKFSNIELIAEGVERAEELRTLIDLGVTHAQGFFLARPGEHSQELTEDVRKIIAEQQQQAQQRSREDIRAMRVGSLASPVHVFDRRAKAEDVRAAAAHSIIHNGAILLDGRRYVGWVSPGAVNDFLQRNDASATLESCNRQQCTVVAEDESLAEVLEIVASRPDDQQALPVVVQRSGSIVGIVVLRNLIRAAARTQRRNLTHFEPLTGLPSRVNADLWLADHIRSHDPVDLAFIDLRSFDSYNLTYGTEMGDAMLLRLAGLIRRMESENPQRIKFSAHLGADRFMVACVSDSQELLRELAGEFDDQREEFFATMDIAACAYRTETPTGERKSIPLTEVRVIYLEKPLLVFVQARELHELAAQLRIRSRDDSDLHDPIVTDRRMHERAVRLPTGVAAQS